MICHSSELRPIGGDSPYIYIHRYIHIYIHIYNLSRPMWFVSWEHPFFAASHKIGHHSSPGQVMLVIGSPKLILINGLYWLYRLQLLSWSLSQEASKVIGLVVLTILRNISQWEGLFHILWKIKNLWNHQPVIGLVSYWNRCREPWVFPVSTGGVM